MITLEQINDLIIEATNELRRIESELMVASYVFNVVKAYNFNTLVQTYEERINKLLESIELQIAIIKELEEELE